jgi:hypothetical protein
VTKRLKIFTQLFNIDKYSKYTGNADKKKVQISFPRDVSKPKPIIYQNSPFPDFFYKRLDRRTCRPWQSALGKLTCAVLNKEKGSVRSEDLLRRILSGKDPEVFLHANIVSETSDCVRQTSKV